VQWHVCGVVRMKYLRTSSLLYVHTLYLLHFHWLLILHRNVKWNKFFCHSCMQIKTCSFCVKEWRFDGLLLTKDLSRWRCLISKSGISGSSKENRSLRLHGSLPTSHEMRVRNAVNYDYSAACSKQLVAPIDRSIGTVGQRRRRAALSADFDKAVQNR